MDIKSRYHIFFILLLFVNYFFPLLIFNEITTFYHDKLDSLVVYNHILGKIYRGELVNADIFLGGEIKTYFLRHYLKPFIILYVIFNTELAYWINDFLVKITCYFSFFIFAKKINKNFFICSLTSALFACINTYTNLGFGCAILPYLVYLIIFKENISLKHYIILIFFGLNTDFIADLFFIPVVLVIVFIINKKIFNHHFFHLTKILIIFFSCAIISSSNIIYVQLFAETMHREEFFNLSVPFLKNLATHILYFFRIPLELNWTFFYNLPYTIFFIPVILFSFLSKNIVVKKFLIFIIAIHLFSLLLDTETIFNLKNNSSVLIKSFNFSWVKIYLPVLHVFLFIYLISNSKVWISKFLIVLGLTSVLIFQINSSAIPIIKEKILKEDNYRNIYTFNGYYLFSEYEKIKKIVQNDRVISIGLDPMIAVMNNIKVIDGYHSLYPLSYKKKFRKVIEKELENNNLYKDYYDNWGSRVYAFVNDKNNILINFDKAKNLGAKYVISKFPVNSEELSFMCDNCNISLFLYEIK